MANQRGLTERGICYDAGTRYVPAALSREVLTDEMIRAEIGLIRGQLRCNAINIFGSDPDRMLRCAEIARDHGLTVWLQPRMIDATPAETVATVARFATAAEELRLRRGDIGLNVGCELTVFMSGIMPGNGYRQRATMLAFLWWLLPLYNRRLNTVLGRLREAARAGFTGRITYGAGTWEGVDWTDFDVVGLNHYRDRWNESSYIRDLKAFHRYGKPVVVVEFGCCPYQGAQRAGGSGDAIVALGADPRDPDRPALRLRKVPVRDERVQAAYIGELIGIYEREDVYGAYVFEFVEPLYSYSADPAEDLDMASFGIVRADPAAHGGSPRWVPKAAFHEIARRYGATADRH